MKQTSGNTDQDSERNGPYEVETERPLRHPLLQERKVGELLGLLLKNEGSASVK